MVGYFKFTLIIVVALILFKDPVRVEQVFAIFLVMFGKFINLIISKINLAIFQFYV